MALLFKRFSFIQRSFSDFRQHAAATFLLVLLALYVIISILIIVIYIHMIALGKQVIRQSSTSGPTL